MRGAIIGFGRIAMGHLAGYSEVPELSITAVVDSSPQRREAAIREYGLRAFSTFEEMLKYESPMFVDICSPPNTHLHYIRLALDADLHALCEKPVFLPSEEGYESLINRVASSDRILYPCHNYKFAPILHAMHDVVARHEFGTVLNAHFRTLRTGHAVGVPEWNPHWRRDPYVAGGGILRDHGPHSIYMATHLTGATPVAVSCVLGNMRRDSYSTTEDSAMLMVRCAEDIEISINLSWSAGMRNTYYSIAGTSGFMAVENDEMYYALNGTLTRQRLISEFDDPSHRGWFSEMFRDFLATVSDPSRQWALIREALTTSVVIDAAYKSAASGACPVDVVLPFEKETSLAADVRAEG